MVEQHAPAVPNGAGWIGERYSIEGELGHGGMAKVYLACDQRTGERVALKQLTLGGDRPAAAQAMFEHEYHALVQLAHPCIVRAFEYGLDPGGPFYTMELLAGADARQVLRSGELTLERTCVLLRDAASALALIHSRRMLHRDISPRNLFCGADGRGKLIDFGSLAPMGAPASIAGTPPFVPPEVVHLQPLDARSDLYALGALAYYLLTGQNAYPAKQVRELSARWQERPEDPHTLRPEIPQALSALVMGLLSLDPRGRPASAAEVSERLSASAMLPLDNERHVAQAFLSTPTLIGRQGEREQARTRLTRLQRGRGGTLVIVGEGGVGRSRMLSTVVLDAKVMGMCAVLVDGASLEPVPYALAAACADQLLGTLPVQPPLSAEATQVLASLSPRLRRALLGSAPALASAPSKRAIESAWLELITDASREQPLVLAIDDVQQADNVSRGLLGQLVALARKQRVLLTVTTRAGQPGTDSMSVDSTSIDQIAGPSRRIALERLDEDETLQLVRSLFGEVEGISDAARFLYEVSQGVPKACMVYAQYLVDEGLARYEGGAWHLPERLRDHALPSSLSAVLEQRVRVLSPDALELALALALARDETRAAWQPEHRVHVEDLPRLLDPAPGLCSARAFAALEELRLLGLVEPRERDYVLCQGAIADAVLRLSTETQRRAAHERLGTVFQAPIYDNVYIAAQQLQLAGEHERARALLLSTAATWRSDWSWGSMRVSVFVACAEAQLAYWQQHGGPVREGVQLRRLLLTACSVWDFRLAEHGDAQLAQLDRDLGLHHWDDTPDDLLPRERMRQCMQRAQAMQQALPEAERGLPADEAALELALVAMPLSGAYVNSLDRPRARALAKRLEYVRTLSPLHALVADLTSLAVDRISGLSIGGRVQSAASRVYEMRELPDVLRQGAAGVYLQVQALEDARCGRERGLGLLDLLAMSTGDSMLIVVHGRYLGHAFGGKASHARRFRNQLDLTGADDAWRRRAYLFIEAQLHALTGDLAALSRVTSHMETLAQSFAGWQPFVAFGRAHAHRMRGEFEQGLCVVDEALAATRAGEHRAYPLLALARIEILLAQGDANAALGAARALIETAHARTLDRSTVVHGERLRALALSALQQHAEAEDCLRTAFTVARELEYGGLPLAQLFLAQAQLAVAANEPREGLKALAVLREHLEHAEAPALIGAYEQLRLANQRQLYGSMSPHQDVTDSKPVSAISQIQSAPPTTASSSDITTTSSFDPASRATRRKG